LAVGAIQGRSHVSKIGGVHLSLLTPYKHPTIAVNGVKGKEWGRVSPLQPTKGLWEHRKLPGGIWCGVPAANDFGAFPVQFYAISRIF